MRCCEHEHRITELPQQSIECVGPTSEVALLNRSLLKRRQNICDNRRYLVLCRVLVHAHCDRSEELPQRRTADAENVEVLELYNLSCLHYHILFQDAHGQRK